MAAVKMSVTELLASAALLTLEEQRTLNTMLVACIKQNRTVASLQQAAAFRINQIVQFDAGPRRGTKMIKIQSIGYTGKIKGKECDRNGTPSGQLLLWTVPAAMAKAVV